MKYLIKEVWKDVEGYEGFYQVSNLGRVKSLERTVFVNGGYWKRPERILKHGHNNDGYHYVIFFVNGNKQQYYVHRLVAIAFIPIQEHLKGIPIEQLQVNHISEVKTDNSVDNLEWCTHQYNINYGTRNEKSSKTQTKTVLQYDLFGNFIKEWCSTKEIINNGFTQSSVWECCNGKLKKHKGFIWRYKETAS